MPTVRELQAKSLEYRQTLLAIIKRAQAGHTSGDLSCVDILNVLYNQILRVDPQAPTSPDRDRYVQSKGHSVEALYVVLADRGFFPAAQLDTLGCYRSAFIGHPTRKVPGIEQNTGALGHGLSVAVGMALAGKMDHRGYRVFCLLGDGELAEGSNWEALLAAAHYRLDNLTAIVDRNRLQITGLTEQVCALEPLAEKFRAFGLAVREADGHDVEQLTEALGAVPFQVDKPGVLIAHTVKGKGVSFMEDQPEWHHGTPSDEEYSQALEELAKARQRMDLETG
jgi:transketolase